MGIDSESATLGSKDPRIEHNCVFAFFEDPARPIDPAALALVAPIGVRDGRVVHQSLTCGQLLERVARLAAGLEVLGVGPGDRVLLMMPMSIPLYTTILAVVKMGAVCLFIDPADGLRQLDRVAARLMPRAYVATPAAHRLRLLCPALRRIPIHITTGTTWWPAAELESVGSTGTPGRATQPVEPEAPAVITFTSGSTGHPKGVSRTHGDQLRIHAQIARHEGKLLRGVNLCAFPLLPFDDLRARRTCVIARVTPGRPAQPDPALLLDQMRQFPPALVSCPPAMLLRILEHAYGLRETVADVRHVYTGGGPLPMTAIRLLPAVMPGAKLHSVYGSTEAEPVAMIDAAQILGIAGAPSPAGAGLCLGRPGPDTSVAIVRPTPDPLERLETVDGIGEIAVSGPHVNRAYFEDPELTRRCKIVDPETKTLWHRMGDLGYVDGQGRLWTVGRMTHRVTTPTRSFDPLAVELIADEVQGVSRSALVGVDVVSGGASHKAAALLIEPRARVHPVQVLGDVRRTLVARGIEVDWIGGVAAIPVDSRIGAKVLRDELLRRHGATIRWMLSEPFVPRFGQYLAERLPPFPTLVAAALFTAAMSGAVGVEGQMVPARLLATTLLVFLFFFHLRIFDEEKDIDVDRVVHPGRVLSRDIVCLEELVPLRRFAQGVQALLALALGRAALTWWLVAVGYSFLMRWEFFARKTLRANLLLYGATHSAVMIPLTVAAARGGSGAAGPPALGILAALLALMAEIARKLETPAVAVSADPQPAPAPAPAPARGPGAGEAPATIRAVSSTAAAGGTTLRADGVSELREESYVRDLGLWPTVALLVFIQVGAFAFGGIMNVSRGAGLGCISLLGLVTATGLVATARFARSPTRRTGKGVHGVTLLQALVQYAVLAMRPFLS